MVHGVPICPTRLVAPLVVDGSPDSVSPVVVWALMVSQVVGLVVPFAVRSWWLYHNILRHQLVWMCGLFDNDMTGFFTQ